MILFLLGCEQPNLHVLSDGLEVQNITANGRQFLSPATAVVSLHNPTAVEVHVEELEGIGYVFSDMELPLVLAPEETHDVMLQIDDEVVDVYSFDLTFKGNFEPKLLTIEGSVDSYIQYQPQEYPQVHDAFAAEFSEQELVGAAIAIVQGQDIVYMEGMGLADREQEVEIDPRLHRFRWASLSKGLTAYVSMQQVELGILDLDAPIADFMPYVQPELFLPDGCDEEACAESVPEDRADISMRLLLSHTAGIQHYSNGVQMPVPSVVDAADPDINTGMEWALPLFVEQPLVAIPKTTYDYTTFGYNLAGVALEYATQQSLPELVESNLSKYAAITTLTPDYQWSPQPNRVVGYDQYNGNVIRSGDTDVSWKLAGGGFQSTVEDLARYCAVLLGDELLMSSYKDELWTVQEFADDYALGFEIKNDGLEVRHSGAQQSTRTGLIIDVERNSCVVAMTNSTWGRPFALVRAIQNAYE